MQKRQNAEKHLELKEESEKATVFPVKENQRFKRFDLLSGLAGAGTVAVLLFECIFVFELYARDFKFLDRLFPAPVKIETSAEPSVLPEPVSPRDKPAKPAAGPERVSPAPVSPAPVSPAPEGPVSPDLLNSVRPVG